MENKVFKPIGSSVPERVMPGMVRQARNATGALLRVVGRAVRREPVLAGAEEVARREAVCGGCELRQGLRCRKCGCWLRAKVRLAGEKCPAGKW